MTTTVRAEHPQHGTVRFGRRSSRGLLLGLSTPRVAAVASAVLVVVTCLYVAGPPGLLLSSPAWASLLAGAYVPVAGRRAVEWLPVAGHWALRRVRRQTTYRSNVLKPRPAGTLA